MKILCFADSNKDLADDIRKRTTPVIKHLIKIWLYPNAQENNHWKREVAILFSDVAKLKRTKKYPSSKFILDNSWYRDEDRIDSLVDNVIGFIDEDPIETTYDAVYDACEEYFFWLANTLSLNNGTANAKEIYTKIEELRIKYFQIVLE